MEKQYQSLLLSRKTKEVLYMLAMAEEPLEVNEIAYRLKRTSRQIYYDLDTINTMLRQIDEMPVLRSGNSYSLSDIQKKRMISLIQNSIRITEKDNRIAYIICKVLFSRDKITIDVLQSELDFSRNSIINDLGQVKKVLSDYNLLLKNSKKLGYYVVGETYNKRYAFCYYLGIFLKSSSYKCMNIYPQDELDECVTRLKRIFTDLSLYIKKRELLVLAYLLLCVHYCPGKERKEAFNKWGKLKEYVLVSKEFPDESEWKKSVYTLIVLSRSIDKRLLKYGENDKTVEIVKQLIRQYEEVTGVALTDHREVIEMLYSHIEISGYCYQYDIPVVNILTGELQKKYGGLLWDLTECCRNIVFPYPVYESEVACFAIPFLAQIPKPQFDFRLKVMLVCSSNYGLEGYLKKEIASLSDKIDIICVKNTNDLRDIQMTEEIDVIISTLNLEASYPIIKVSTIITKDDKKRINLFLLKAYQKKFDMELNKN